MALVRQQADSLNRKYAEVTVNEKYLSNGTFLNNLRATEKYTSGNLIAVQFRITNGSDCYAPGKAGTTFKKTTNSIGIVISLASVYFAFSCSKKTDRMIFYQS